MKISDQQKKLLGFAALMFAVLAPEIASAATTGAAFNSVYTFVYEAATGYLGRSIAIVGGLIGLGIGAGTGKALPAAMGVILAIFGALGPTVIDTLFASATI